MRDAIRSLGTKTSRRFATEAPTPIAWPAPAWNFGRLEGSKGAPGRPLPPLLPPRPSVLPAKAPSELEQARDIVNALTRDTSGMIWVEAYTLRSQYGDTHAVAGFWIDRMLVTNAEYRAFVDGTGEVSSAHGFKGRPGPDTDRHPVVGVTLAAARRYARWVNNRLPTNLEWESMATRGGTRRFPWGDVFRRELCNGPHQKLGKTTPVGAFAGAITVEAGEPSVSDVLGNVWAWTELDPRTSGPDAQHIWVFGGSYRHACVQDDRFARTAVSEHNDYWYLGFRCAESKAALA